MEFFLIYLVMSVMSLADIVSTILVICALAIPIVGFFVYMFADINDDAEKLVTYISSHYRKAVILFACAVLFVSFVPDKSDMKYIVGGGLAWRGIQSAADIEGINKLPENLVKAVNHFLKETTDE